MFSGPWSVSWESPSSCTRRRCVEGPNGLERDKELVRRLVEEAINDDNATALDEVCTGPLASELQQWFTPFRAAFPDWRQEIVELVAEADTVVARCRCRGTNLGEWLGVPPTGRSMEVDEVWFFGIAGSHLDRMWSLEDTWGRIVQLGTARHAIEAAGGAGSQASAPSE